MVLGYGSAASDVYVVAPRNQKPGERYVRLPGGSSLNFSVNYRALHASDRRTRTATIASYRYGLYDRDGREVLSYHWHPDTYSHMTTPHLHLGGGVAAWRPDVAKAHIPTGYVTLEAVATRIMRRVMKVTGFSHVTIDVRDLPASLLFYVDLLGMRLVHRGEHDVYLEWGAAWLCLQEREQENDAAPGQEPTWGVDHVAFHIDQADFDAAPSNGALAGASIFLIPTEYS